jgi:3,4-dihydroxy 2-butanone 4-phosphate synthase/GTP cyclohydrolase II
MAMIEAEGRGVLVYLAQEGRGIGLLNKLRAYRLQEEGLDTVEANQRLGLAADLRDYGVGAEILADLGLTSIRLVTNNPKKIRGLEGYGLHVTDQVPIVQAPNPYNEAYMRTKRQRMGHLLPVHHQGLNLDAEFLLSERKQRAADQRAQDAKDAREQRVQRLDGTIEIERAEGEGGL